MIPSSIDFVLVVFQLELLMFKVYGNFGISKIAFFNSFQALNGLRKLGKIFHFFYFTLKI